MNKSTLLQKKYLQSKLSKEAANFLHVKRPSIFPIKSHSYYGTLHKGYDGNDPILKTTITAIRVMEGFRFEDSTSKPYFRII